MRHAPAPAGFLVTAALLFATGCGASSKRTSSSATASPAAAADGGTPSRAPLGPLPQMAVMPKPGVAGSRKVDLRASATKMVPLGPPLGGTQSDRDAHQEHRVHVAKGRCVRAAVTVEVGSHDVVVVARDEAGDIIAESSGATVPETGVMCFRDEGDLSLLVAVGTGKATYALQVWSD